MPGNLWCNTLKISPHNTILELIKIRKIITKLLVAGEKEGEEEEEEEKQEQD